MLPKAKISGLAGTSVANLHFFNIQAVCGCFCVPQNSDLSFHCLILLDEKLMLLVSN